MKRKISAVVAAMVVLVGLLWAMPELFDQRSQAAAADAATANLARRPGVTVRQFPDTSHPGTAVRAVDGNTDGRWTNNSVSHTGVTGDPIETPWWEIDLGRTVPLDRVVLWNRTDCCAERLNDFTVFVSDQPLSSNVVQWNTGLPGVWHRNIRAQVNGSMVVPTLATGRYVRIHQRRNVWLSLAEVQVFASPAAAGLDQTNRNLARDAGSVAAQSSDWPTASGPAVASRATDGNTSGRWVDNSIAHTAGGRTDFAWWQTMFADVRAVRGIRIHNRTDCSDRMVGAYLFVSDRPFTSNDPKVVAADPSITTFRISGTQALYTFNLSRTARYVRIQPGVAGRVLNLAEVEVLGFTPVQQRVLPAETLPGIYHNRAEALRFSVRGVVAAGQGYDTFPAGELTEVWALKVIGDTVYVGGKFLEVVDNATGAAVSQRFLAAFKVADGSWVSSFRPALSGAVSDLQATPDGRLVVAGAFRGIGGAAAKGLAVLDPRTGALDPNWRGGVDGGNAVVMEADVQGPWIYAAGGFTSGSGGRPESTVTGYRNAARFALADGAPDRAWKPLVNAGHQGSLVTGLDASSNGARVYLSGFFGNVNGAAGTQSTAWVNTTSGAPIGGIAPHVPDYPATEAQMWDVVEGPGNLVYEIGTQHTVGAVNKGTKADVRSHSTWCQRPLQTSCGGDFQAGGVVGSSVFVTCHCLGSTYFRDIGLKQLYAVGTDKTTAYRQPAQGVIRLDGATGEPDPDFAPEVWYAGGAKGTGQGAWAVAGDDRDCLWVGGGVESMRLRTSGKRVAQVGFARFCPADAVAPAAPSGLVVSRRSGGGATLRWNDAKDDRPARSFEVLRNGVVVGEATTTTFDDPAGRIGDVYLVRTMDGRGNRSATTTPVTLV